MYLLTFSRGFSCLAYLPYFMQNEVVTYRGTGRNRGKNVGGYELNFKYTRLFFKKDTGAIFDF